MWDRVEHIFAAFGLPSISILLFRFTSFIYFYYIQGPTLRAATMARNPRQLSRAQPQASASTSC